MNYLPRLLVLAVVIALSGALVIGCVSDSSAQLTQIRIGYQPSTHQMAHITAMEKGWWKEDLRPFGITNVTDYLFPTGAPEMQAMLAGEIDVAYTGAAPVLSALTTGLDAKIVAAVQTQGSDLVLRTSIPYRTPADLKGLTIATYPPGTIQDTLLRDWLKKNGIDPATDLEIKGLASAGDSVTALTAGQVDGVFLPHPAPATIAKEGTGRTVVKSGEMVPNHACCVLLVSGKLIREHPQVVTQIVKTHIRATEYNREHLVEAAQIFAAKTGTSPEVVNASVLEWDGAWVADPNLIFESVVDYAKFQYELGYIKKPLSKEDIFDLSFYEKAIK